MEADMPTDKPRVQVTLDEESNGLLALLAMKHNKSVSATAADLIREALEMHEDLYLSTITNQRILDNADTKTISHDDAWG
jgi:predicted DNA-binding protein